MLDKLKNWLQPQHKQTEPPSIELSTAVLMLDIAVADGSIDNDEVAGIRALLRDEFALDSDALEQVMSSANQLLQNSVDMYDYARVVCHSLPVVRRERLLTGMWRVAMADDDLHQYEEGRLRMLSDLMGLSHSEFMQAKHKAMAAVAS